MFGKKDNNKFSDLELVHRYRFSHDAKYIGELYLRYTYLVYGICIKYVGNDDASKEAVLEIYEKLIVDLKKHEVKNFKTWLYAVVKNHCLIKARKDHSDQVKVTELNKITEEQSTFEKFINIDRSKSSDIQLLKEAIESLPPKQKQCVELFYLEAKENEEIVKLSGFDMMAVMSYLQNGKRNIKKYISEKKDNAKG